MTTEDLSALPDPQLHHGGGRSFAGRIEFLQLVRNALAVAAREGWKELVLSDALFDDWPLNEREVVASLDAWAQGGRGITLLARSYNEFTARHPRFVIWRRRWDHLITCRRCATADVGELPSAIWSPVWAMERIEPTHSRGWQGDEPARRVRIREDVNEWLRKSSAGFPASTLGL